MYLDHWGPIAWELFHYITYTFKPELRDYYIIYYKTLYSIIPCPNCSSDIRQVLNKDENLTTLHLYSKDAMIKWFIKIHNIVNIKTNNSNRFDINMAFMPHVRTRVKLGKRLRTEVTKNQRNKADSDWFKQQAEAAEILLDEEEEEVDSVFRRKETTLEERLRYQLKEMLSQPLLGRGGVSGSRKYQFGR